MAANFKNAFQYASSDTLKPDTKPDTQTCIKDFLLKFTAFVPLSGATLLATVEWKGFEF